MRIRKSSDKSYPASQAVEKKGTEQFKNRMVAVGGFEPPTKGL